jgi:hypothetical protein
MEDGVGIGDSCHSVAISTKVTSIPSSSGLDFNGAGNYHSGSQAPHEAWDQAHLDSVRLVRRPALRRNTPATANCR